jgi:hypothetical protein
MSARTEQLAQKRRDLQMQCALQRQQVAYLSDNIEARLTTVDRVLNVVSSIARNPLAMVGIVAGTMMLGPWRIMRWASQGVLLFKVARRVQHLLGK